MDNYPEEFTELQKRPNDDLAGLYTAAEISVYNNNNKNYSLAYICSFIKRCVKPHNSQQENSSNI